MAYKVLEDFKEKYDNDRVYKKDEQYPADGFEPDEERIKELSTERNYFNRPFIAEIEINEETETEETKETAEIEETEEVLSESKVKEEKPTSKSKSKGKEVKNKVADKNAKDKG